jgi:hypothetical protein
LSSDETKRPLVVEKPKEGEMMRKNKATAAADEAKINLYPELFIYKHY